MSQYATFQLKDRMFGLDILLVREIIRVFDVTPVPRTAPHIRGILNLRGQVVTLIDLAVRLGMEPPQISDNSHIVILKTAQELGHNGKTITGFSGTTDLVGLLVDAIGDVVEADESKEEAPPANLLDADERFLRGVIKTDVGLLVMLNLQDVLYSN